MIDAELRRYLPFLASTKVLVAAVQEGVGREVAHEVIKEHAVATALSARDGAATADDLVSALGADDRIPLDADQISAVLADPLAFTGAARQQVGAFVADVEKLVARHPQAASYDPAPIL